MIPEAAGGGLWGIAAHHIIPEGESLGATFQHSGETFYVTQAELDRVRAMPDAEAVQKMVANLRAALPGK